MVAHFVAEVGQQIYSGSRAFFHVAQTRQVPSKIVVGTMSLYCLGISVKGTEMDVLRSSVIFFFNERDRGGLIPACFRVLALKPQQER